MSQFFTAVQNGGMGAVTSVSGTHGVTASPTVGAVIVSGVDATTSTVGVASFNPAQFTVTSGAVSLLNAPISFSGSATTIGATTANPVTIALGLTPGAYFIKVEVALFSASGPAGAGYETYTTVRTDGTTATIIDATDSITQEDASLISSTAQMIVSSNNAIFQVGGVTGLTIDWVVIGTYIKAI